MRQRRPETPAETYKREKAIVKKHPENGIVERDKLFFLQAHCIFCKEQIHVDNIYDFMPEGTHYCPNCGDIWLGPEEKEDFYRFFSRKTDLVSCNAQKREIHAPASCLTCREPLKAYLLDDEYPNGNFWACFNHGAYINFGTKELEDVPF